MIAFFACPTMEQALKSQPDRTAEQITTLKAGLQEPLIDLPKSHGAVFAARDAKAAGLDVVEADPAGLQWKAAWALWSKYFLLRSNVFEGRRASWVSSRDSTP